MLTGSLPFAVRTAREKWNEEKTTTKRLLESCSFQGRFCFWLPIMLRVLQERGGKKLRVRRSFSFWGSRCAPLIAVLASDLNGRSMSAKDWQSLHRFGPNWKKVPTWWEEWNDKQKQCFQAPTKWTNSLKLTFSQLTIECLEDYILSFNRSSFQVQKLPSHWLKPATASPLDIPTYHQVKTSALSRRLCFLAGKEWRIFVHPRENRRVVSKAGGFFFWLGVFLFFKLLLLCSQCGVASSL